MSRATMQRVRERVAHHPIPSDDMTTYIRSGIAPLDRQIRGFARGHLYLVSGRPGSGKGTACLEFINAGIQDGERGVIITHDHPESTLATAAFIGVDLETALVDDRVRLVTFQPDFVRRASYAATHTLALEELRRHIGSEPIQRVALHSITPFLDGAGSEPQAMYSLIEFLDALQVTALVSYPEDGAGLYDGRLEPLFHRANGVFHLSAVDERHRRGMLRIRKLRHPGVSLEPVRFRIDPGAGYTPDDEPREQGVMSIEQLRRPLEILQAGASVPPRLLAAMRMYGAVLLHESMRMRATVAMRHEMGALVLCARHETLEDVLSSLRALRAGDARTRVVLLLRSPLRARDRIRALRAGADEVLEMDISESEFLRRLHALVNSGRSHGVTDDDASVPSVRQPRDTQGRYHILDPESFVAEVQHASTAVTNPPFSLLRIVAADRAHATLAELMLRNLRVASGDFAGLRGDGIVAYLEGVLPAHLDGVVNRLGRQWVEHGGPPFEVEAMCYPSAGGRFEDFLRRSDR